MVLTRFTFWEIFQMLILPSVLDTLKMVAISGVLATFIGMLLGIVLVLTDKDGLSPNRVVFRVFDILVNVIRSFPFIILIVTIIPLTRLIVGSSIGDTAALVPLTVACGPFMGRIFQNAFKEVDPALIEAARSFGASKRQIMFRVYMKEGLPAVISGLSLGLINLLGCTAMAGAVGAGGLGAIALQYGYQNFNVQVMYSIVVILIVLVALIQYLGDWVYRRLK